MITDVLQDVHEGTATIREAMRFSAYLRQPASVSIAEKASFAFFLRVAWPNTPPGCVCRGNDRIVGVAGLGGCLGVFSEYVDISAYLPRRVVHE
jgi:hypothetical protein